MQNPYIPGAEAPSASSSSGNGWRRFAVFLIFAIIVFILAISGRAYLADKPTEEAEATSQAKTASGQSLQFTDTDGQMQEIYPPSAVVTPTIEASTQATPEASTPSARWDGSQKHCEQLGGTYNPAERSCHY